MIELYLHFVLLWRSWQSDMKVETNNRMQHRVAVRQQHASLSAAGATLTFDRERTNMNVAVLPELRHQPSAKQKLINEAKEGQLIRNEMYRIEYK